MRIGICGAQGTGKSTLAKVLAKELQLPLITEQARLVAKRMGVVSESELRQRPKKEQIEFQINCLVQQIHAECSHPGGFVSDRTTIDNAVYWVSSVHNDASYVDRVRYLQEAQLNARDYDLVVYCRPFGSVEDDGFRIPDNVYQREIDLLIRTFIIGWELKNWVTVDGSLEERVAQVLDVVQDMKRRL